jgi:acyl dehydratase
VARELKVGDRASISKAFSAPDVEQFARLSLDANPLHLDEAAAANSVVGQRVVHGALVASLFSALLGTELPGEGSIYLGQNTKYKSPVFLDEEITATVEVVEVRESRKIARLKTTAVNSAGKTVIEGEATVKFA